MSATAAVTSSASAAEAAEAPGAAEPMIGSGVRRSSAPATAAVSSRTTSAPVKLATPMVRWMEVPARATAECSQPRGRYSASPGRITTSSTGSSRARAVTAARYCDQGSSARGWVRTGAWIRQCFSPLTCSTNTSCTS